MPHPAEERDVPQVNSRDDESVTDRDHADPNGDPMAKKPWEPETADLCATKPQFRHCSEDEVLAMEFALSQTYATQAVESPETAFVTWYEKSEEFSCREPHGIRADSLFHMK